SLNADKIPPVEMEKHDCEPKIVQLPAVKKNVAKHIVSTKSVQVVQADAIATEHDTFDDSDDSNQWLKVGGLFGDVAAVMFFIFSLHLLFFWFWVGLVFFLIGSIFIAIGGRFEGRDSWLLALIVYIGYAIYMPFYLIYLAVRGIVKSIKEDRPSSSLNTPPRR